MSNRPDPRSRARRCDPGARVTHTQLQLVVPLRWQTDAMQSPELCPRTGVSISFIIRFFYFFLSRFGLTRVAHRLAINHRVIEPTHGCIDANSVHGAWCALAGCATQRLLTHPPTHTVQVYIQLASTDVVVASFVTFEGTLPEEPPQGILTVCAPRFRRLSARWIPTCPASIV